MIGAADSEDFRKRLLAEAGIAVIADIHFGSRVPGEGQHVRFSYAASKHAIEAGVRCVGDFIRKNTPQAPCLGGRACLSPPASVAAAGSCLSRSAPTGGWASIRPPAPWS